MSNVASTSIDENLLIEFLEEDGIDVSTAKFLHVSFIFLPDKFCKSCSCLLYCINVQILVTRF